MTEVESERANADMLAEALREAPDWILALGEHGPKIVVESEEAKDARWPHDPAFVTKLAEVMRVYADVMAKGLVKRSTEALAAHDARRGKEGA